MQERIGMHSIVSGKVQGVWFRAATQDTANALNLTGWVRNLADGRVEVLAFGEKEPLQQLYVWLQQGPELAQVTQVTYEEVAWQEHTRFAIK